MFSKIITLFALISSATAKSVVPPTKKPVQPPTQKPKKGPTFAPTFHVERTTYSSDIKDFNSFLPISDANGKY